MDYQKYVQKLRFGTVFAGGYRKALVWGQLGLLPPLHLIRQHAGPADSTVMEHGESAEVKPELKSGQGRPTAHLSISLVGMHVTARVAQGRSATLVAHGRATVHKHFRLQH